SGNELLRVVTAEEHRDLHHVAAALDTRDLAVAELLVPNAHADLQRDFFLRAGVLAPAEGWTGRCTRQYPGRRTGERPTSRRRALAGTASRRWRRGARRPAPRIPRPRFVFVRIETLLVPERIGIALAVRAPRILPRRPSRTPRRRRRRRLDLDALLGQL